VLTSPPTQKCDEGNKAFFYGILKMATYQLYEYEKQRWLSLHPDATEAQITRAFIAIAKKLGL
jgi:hypothetical protein